MSTNEAAEKLHHFINNAYHFTEKARTITSHWLDAALAHERSAGAAPIEVEVLEDAMDEVAGRTDANGLGYVHWEYAGLVVDEYNRIAAARLVEGTDDDPT